jgi:hypothetical protein
VGNGVDHLAIPGTGRRAGTRRRTSADGSFDTDRDRTRPRPGRRRDQALPRHSRRTRLSAGPARPLSRGALRARRGSGRRGPPARTWTGAPSPPASAHRSSGTRPTAATQGNSAPARPSSARWSRGRGRDGVGRTGSGDLRRDDGGAPGPGRAAAGRQSRTVRGGSRVQRRHRPCPARAPGALGRPGRCGRTRRTGAAHAARRGRRHRARGRRRHRPAHGTAADRTPPGHTHTCQLLPRRFGGFGRLTGRRPARTGPRNPRPASDRHHPRPRPVGGRGGPGRRRGGSRPA